MPDQPAKPSQRRVPNLLTISRVVLAVVFVVLLSVWPDRFRTSSHGSPTASWINAERWPLLAAAGLFVVAALTDALDGYLARRWNVVSQFGRVMDPFADKLLVLGAFALLAGPRFSVASGNGAAATQVTAVEPWMVVVILARELLVTSLRGVMEARGVDFSATASGKLKMILQSVCVPAVLVIVGAGNPLDGAGRAAIVGLVWATVLVTAWSGVPYVLRAISKA